MDLRYYFKTSALTARILNQRLRKLNVLHLVRQYGISQISVAKTGSVVPELRRIWKGG